MGLNDISVGKKRLTPGQSAAGMGIWAGPALNSDGKRLLGKVVIAISQAKKRTG